MIHALKIAPDYFEAVRSGEKTFELRKNDRDFHVGDFLALNEYIAAEQRYTGRTQLVRVKYLLNPNAVMTCQAGYAILAIRDEGEYDSPRGKEGSKDETHG